MVLDTVAATLRVIIWIVLLGVVLPPVIYRTKVPDATGRVARVALCAVCAASVLWLLDQLSTTTFLIGTGMLTLRTASFPSKSGELTAAQALMLWLVRVSYFPRKPPAEGAPSKGDTAPGPVSLLSDVQNFYDTSLARMRANFSIGRVAATREKLHRVATRLAVPAAMGLCGAVAKGFGEIPVSAEEAERALRLAGWSYIDAHIPDLAFVELASAISGTQYSLATVSAAGAKVALAAFLAQAAGQRLEPRVSPWLFGVAGATVPCAWVATGHTAELSLVAPLLCCLCTVSLDGRARRSSTPFTLCAVAAFVGPLSGLMTLAAFLVFAAVERAERKAVAKIAWLKIAATVVGVSALLGYLHFGDLDVALESLAKRDARLSTVLGRASIFLSTLLLFTRIGSQSQDRSIAQRNLGILLGIATFLSGGADGNVRWPIPSTFVLTILPIALLVSTAKLPSVRALRIAALSASTALVLLLGGYQVREATAVEGLSRRTMELVRHIEEDHQPWSYTLVAPRRYLPAIAGSGWYLADDAIEASFPAALYSLSPKPPYRAIGTKHTYVVTPKYEDSHARQWLQRLQERGVSMRVIDVPGDPSVVMFQLTRED